MTREEKYFPVIVISKALAVRSFQSRLRFVQGFIFWCATATRRIPQLGRDFNVPMRIANLALAELSEALNRGWGDRDSRSPMILQQERAGVEIGVDPKRIEEAVKHGDD